MMTVADLDQAEREAVQGKLTSRGLVSEGGCILWQAARTKAGYGVLAVKHGGAERLFYTHRLVYEMAHGPIPANLTIDHLCRTPACFNITHLELATNRENSLRGNGTAARNLRKTVCLRGHPFSGANLRINHRPNHRYPDRVCRACIRIRTHLLKEKNSVKLTCKRCGHQWLPRVAVTIACPKCKTYKWQQPKVAPK